MIGKGSEIKYKLVLENPGTVFDITLNDCLEELGSAEITSIQFRVSTDEDGVGWFSALIIYKEATK